MVLVEDLNTQSQPCDPRCTEWREFSCWEETIHEHRLVIRQDDGPTNNWTRDKSACELIKGRTLAHRPFGK